MVSAHLGLWTVYLVLALFLQGNSYAYQSLTVLRNA